jgi:hypothetical protein
VRVVSRGQGGWVGVSCVCVCVGRGRRERRRADAASRRSKHVQAMQAVQHVQALQAVRAMRARTYLGAVVDVGRVKHIAQVLRARGVCLRACDVTCVACVACAVVCLVRACDDARVCARVRVPCPQSLRHTSHHTSLNMSHPSHLHVGVQPQLVCLAGELAHVYEPGSDVSVTRVCDRSVCRNV